MHYSKIATLAATSAMMIVMASNQSMAQQIGVVGLFNSQDSVAVEIDKQKISDLKCHVRREGIIGGENGDINIAKPNRFVFLACDGSLLNDPARRKALTSLVSNSKTIAILEGALNDAPGLKGVSAVADRNYILKVSYYNNRDTDAREQDLARIMAAVKPKADAFVDEASIVVNRALGMPTPDEVVILFYGNPKMGNRFRENNPDILNEIGAFNKAHLNDYIYYGAKVTE